MVDFEESRKQRARFYGSGEAPEKDLPDEERQRFWQEVEVEIPDWARDEEGNVVLLLYVKEAQRIVRQRWFGKSEES
jgi:hypothetical protein